MKNLTRKLTSAAVAGTTFLAIAAPAFAGTNTHITGNGSDSDNRVSVKQGSRTNISQSSRVNVGNSVNIHTNTGNNRANDNTDGDVSIRTGDINTSVRIANRVNSNFLNLGGSGRGGFGNHFFGHKLHTFMTGAKEVPGPGDSNGFGFAKVKLHPSDDKLCVQIRVFNITRATAAHIHEAPKDEAGPVVVTLPTPNSNGVAAGCVNVDNDLLEDIKGDPSDYYVNIHNTPFPNGAVRGQLK